MNLGSLPSVNDHLLGLIEGRDRQAAPGPRRSLQDRLHARSLAAQGGAGDYGATALARELEALSRAQRGQRNHALNSAAFSVFQIVASGHLDIADAEAGLRATASSLGLSDQEVTQTLRSAADGAERNPRPPSRLPDDRRPESATRKRTAADVLPTFDEDGNILAPEGYDDFASKMKTTGEMLAWPRPAPLIDGILFKGTVAALYGHPGSMKSFVAIDWAMSIALGSWWFGRAVERGQVLYCVAEGASGAGPRIEAWMDEQKVYHEPENLEWYPEQGQLLNFAWVNQLAHHARRTQPSLVVVDTLSRSMAGGDENDSVDMTAVIDNLGLVQRVAGCTVLLVHHSPKVGGGLRGHSSLHGACDTEIEVRKDSNHIKLHCAKQKDAEEFDDMTLWWKPTKSSIVLTTTPQETDSDQVQVWAEDVWSTLHTQFRHTGASVSLLTEACSLPELAVAQAINRLFDEGRMGKEGAKFQARVGRSPGDH